MDGYLSVGTWVFFAIIGLLSGFVAANSAETTPFGHWLEALRRAGQIPGMLGLAQQAAAHAVWDGSALFEPETVWIRVALAVSSIMVFHLCKAFPQAGGSTPRPR